MPDSHDDAAATPDTSDEPASSTLTVADAEAGERLDLWLAARLPALSRRAAGQLVKAGALRLITEKGEREVRRKGEPVRAGDQFRLLSLAGETPGTAPADAPPTAKRIDDIALVWMDAHLLVISKPAGVPSHPLKPGEIGTAANHLVRLDPSCANAGQPAREGGLCHRLDTLTSGLLVGARSAEAWEGMRAAFNAQQVSKTYLALVHGHPSDFEVAAAIETRGRGAVQVGVGHDAHTVVTVEERFEDATMVTAVSRSGRRHQIRAHLAYQGYPLVADTLYGGDKLPGWERELLLHALRMEFVHPVTGEQLALVDPLKPDQADALVALRL